MPCHDAFDHFHVGPCPFDQRREALLHLAAISDPASQAELKRALGQAANVPDFDWQGLWVACRAGRIEAALWVEPLGGATARLWLPATDHQRLDTLLAGARQWVTQKNYALCHVALDAGQTQWAARLSESGMQAMAELSHLAKPLSVLPAASQMLAPAPFGALDRARQLALLKGVSEASQDCKALLDVLPIQTLLAGFYAGAPAAPNHWYRMLYNGETAGVLFLTPQSGRRWELQLMGLLPGWRGQGLGHALLLCAMNLAFAGGARELALTVDACNAPAMKLYNAAGFECEATQSLYAWCR